MNHKIESELELLFLGGIFRIYKYLAGLIDFARGHCMYT